MISQKQDETIAQTGSLQAETLKDTGATRGQQAGSDTMQRQRILDMLEDDAVREVLRLPHAQKAQCRTPE